MNCGGTDAAQLRGETLFKFIHAADIHLDSPLKGLEQYEGAPTEEIRGATRRALENLVDLALERDVDFVLIAGDLYDGDWKDHNTGLFYVSQMARLREREIPVVMISGNHDAANRMTKTLRLPENVELLGHRRPQTCSSPKLRELGIAVHGQSFATAAVHENLAREYPARQSGLFNIGLLHTSLTGAEGHEPYAPCTIEDLRQKEYDYWALGHVHNRDVRHEDPHVVFCGNLQGRHIRETGPKGCYVVTVDGDRRPALEFQSLDVFRWEELHLRGDSAERADDLLDLFAAELAAVMKKHAGLPLALRVSVHGRSRAHERLAADRVYWSKQFRATAVDVAGGRVWIEKVKLRTAPARDPDEIIAGDGPVAELFRYVGELVEDEMQLKLLRDEFNDLRRKLPDELLRGDGLNFDDPEWMKELLGDVQPLLMSRLLEADTK